MRKRIVARLALAAGLVLSLYAYSSAQDAERERELTQLRERLQGETKLEKNDLDDIGPELKEYVNRGGHGDEVRDMVKASLENGCRGVCLAATLRSMNRAMARGMSDRAAREMVSNELREQVREGKENNLIMNNKELGERVRQRVEDRLKTHEKMREEKRDRENDGYDRDMRHDHPGMGGGMKGRGR